MGVVEEHIHAFVVFTGPVNLEKSVELWYF